MPIKDTDFIDSSAYLRVQEKRLLTKAGLDRVADARDVRDAMRMLSQNSDYDFTALKADEDYEGLLKQELVRVYKLAYSLSPCREVVDVLACKYDYHNLKAALKAHYFPQRTAVPYVRVTDLAPETLELLAGGAKADVPVHMLQAAELAREAYEKEENPQVIDLVLDRCMFGHMLQLTQELGDDFISGYVEQAIDFYNLKTLLRVKAMQRGTAFLSECLVEGSRTGASSYLAHYNKAPGAMAAAFATKSFGKAVQQGVEIFEKTGNFAGLERILDNCITEYTKAAKYVAFGPEILFAYLLSKENEIRQVRIVMTCKSNAIGPEALRERLRESYA